jgi:hypothetical protein
MPSVSACVILAQLAKDVRALAALSGAGSTEQPCVQVGVFGQGVVGVGQGETSRQSAHMYTMINTYMWAGGLRFSLCGKLELMCECRIGWTGAERAKPSHPMT